MNHVADVVVEPGVRNVASVARVVELHKLGEDLVGHVHAQRLQRVSELSVGHQAVLQHNKLDVSAWAATRL